MADSYVKHLSPHASKNVGRWLHEPKYSEYCDELRAMIAGECWQDIEDAFFQVIEFGTGGIRGTTGIGSNRINRVTIGEAAQALCEYAADTDKSAPEKGIVIAYDTRLTSDDLSKYVAEVCAGNGFKVYLFDGFRSTPELSFAVRHLKCSAGIVISASHNPPADNGFKAYWSDGGQLVSPHDKSVIAIAANISEIRHMPLHDAQISGKVTMISDRVDDAYIHTVTNEAVGTHRDVSIVYSPLHGAGQTNTLPVLKAAGFNSISTVVAQMTPDGNFPTIENGKPNPEEKSANDRAVAQMMNQNADIAITNDPDADRIGVTVRHNNEAIYLNGNQSAVLATEFTLQQLLNSGKLTNTHFIAKTIVTTDMLHAIADKYAVKTYGDMLIGFKYIGELLLQKEGTEEKFVIGGEESYGLLKGTYARDKDGAVGALLLAEFAADLKRQGKTLYDKLSELYMEYGLFEERLDTIICPGASGFEQMQDIMARLRSQPPMNVAHHAVTAVSDYQALKKRDTRTGTETETVCRVKGNIIVLEFGDERCRVTVRPSGTEPKIKLYVQWYQPANSNEMQGIHDQRIELSEQLESLSRTLEGLLLA